MNGEDGRDMLELRATAELARSRMGLDVGSRLAPATFTLPEVTMVDIKARAEDAEAKLAVERQRAAERKRAARIASADGVIPPALRWARDGAEDLRRRVGSPTAIADAWLALRAPRIVFMGPAGSGKSSLACAAIRRWLEADTAGEAFFAASWRIESATSEASLGSGKPEIVARAQSAGLFVLDDLGSEGSSETFTRYIREIVAHRHEQGTPTWVTTWMDPKQMAAKFGDGIARRVFERAKIVVCGKPKTTEAK